MTVKTASYTITGPNAVALQFAPAVGTSTASLEYSSDGENWNDYGIAFNPAVGVLSNLSGDTYHYFRLKITNGVNKGISNVVIIYLASDVTTYPVTVNSAGTDASGSGNYMANTTVTINAGTPPVGRRFSGWTASPDVAFANANSANTSFTMPAYGVTVTASFAAQDTGIDNPQQDKAQRAYIQNGTLHVTGLTVGKQWAVYDILGELLYCNIAGDNEAEVYLSVRGVYVVKSGNKTIKVVYRQ